MNQITEMTNYDSIVEDMCGNDMYALKATAFKLFYQDNRDEKLFDAVIRHYCLVGKSEMKDFEFAHWLDILVQMVPITILWSQERSQLLQQLYLTMFEGLEKREYIDHWMYSIELMLESWFSLAPWNADPVKYGISEQIIDRLLPKMTQWHKFDHSWWQHRLQKRFASEEKFLSDRQKFEEEFKENKKFPEI